MDFQNFQSKGIFKNEQTIAFLYSDNNNMSINHLFYFGCATLEKLDK